MHRQDILDLRCGLWDMLDVDISLWGSGGVFVRIGSPEKDIIHEVIEGSLSTEVLGVYRESIHRWQLPYDHKTQEVA